MNYGCLQAGTDICITGLAHPVHTYIQEYGAYITPAWGLPEFWDWAYILIGNANQVLANVNNEDVIWDKPTDKNRIEAEARFFRAFAYRDLIYLYGDVPLVTELTKPFRTDFTRQSVSEVLDLIIEDLLFAVDNLPAPPSTNGKLSKAAAQHLLAEIYLYANEPALAEQQSKLVVESPDYKLMTDRFGEKKGEPGDVFSDLFQEHNYNRTSGNLESIFVIQWEFDVNGGASVNEMTRRAWVAYYASVPGFVLCDSLGGRGVGRLRPLQWWFDAYEPQDIRNSKYKPNPKIREVPRQV